MRKIICFILSLTFITALSFTSFAETTKINYLEELVPYQEIISKINSEYGASITIPEGKEKEVFENISGMSPEEFEIYTRQGYEAVIREQPSGAVTESEIAPKMDRAFFYNVEILTRFEYGNFYLNATLVDDISGMRFYQLGSSGTYGYIGDSYFFEVRSRTFSYYNNNKECIGTFYGAVVDSKTGIYWSDRTYSISYRVEPVRGTIISNIF